MAIIKISEVVVKGVKYKLALLRNKNDKSDKFYALTSVDKKYFINHFQSCGALQAPHAHTITLKGWNAEFVKWVKGSY